MVGTTSKVIHVRSPAEIDEQIAALLVAAEKARAWLHAHDGSAMELFHALKFDPVGFHPVHGHALNIIEQVNITSTYAAAFEAVRLLMELHPEEPGFLLAPGAHMALPLDIMSEEAGRVGAEVFAAVHPRNNRKLDKDLAKMAERDEMHRYVIFASPKYPEKARHPELELDGVQVWSISSALSAPDQCQRAL